MLSIGRRTEPSCLARKLHYFRPDGRAQPLIQTSLFHQSETMVKNSKKPCVSSILCKRRRICGECINFAAIFIRNRLWRNLPETSFSLNLNLTKYAKNHIFFIFLKILVEGRIVWCEEWRRESFANFHRNEIFPCSKFFSSEIFLHFELDFFRW